MLPHVPLRQLDEVPADLVPHAARAAVEHEPDTVRFVQAHLDEVVARAERAEMGHVVRALDPPVLGRDRVEPGLETLPGGEGRGGRVLPRTLVATPRCPPVRHRPLDRRAHRAQALGQVPGGQRGSDGRHAAADVHPDRGRDDRAHGRDDAAHGGADPPVDIGHRRYPAVDAGKPRHVPELLGRGLLEAHPPNPCLDGHPAVDLDDLVRPLGAHVAALSSPFGRNRAHGRFTRWYTICSLPSGSANTANA